MIQDPSPLNWSVSVISVSNILLMLVAVSLLGFIAGKLYFKLRNHK